MTASRERTPEVVDVWLDDARVRKISFTGSTPVGKHLARRSADTLKKLSLELGGNAPFIVFEDADLDAAVEGLMAAKFRNGGQTCVCPEPRVRARAPCTTPSSTSWPARVGALKVGPATEPDSQIGPMINARAVEKIERHVQDAVARGAKVLTGGSASRAISGPNYYAPTVLVNADATMACSCEETFGPVVPITRFDSEAEVIAAANDTPFGLAAYFYLDTTCAASGAWPRRWRPASSASTKARSRPRPRPSAASRTRATAAKARCMGSTTTCTSSTCAKGSCSSARSPAGMLVRLNEVAVPDEPIGRRGTAVALKCAPPSVRVVTMNSPLSKHRIVIVGGGAGGLELATRLGDTLGKRGMADITLIDKHRTHVWKPKLHEIAAGSMDMSAHEVDYLAQAHWHRFRFRLGEMTGIDRERREVRVAPYLDDEGRRGHAAIASSATTRWSSRSAA